MSGLCVSRLHLGRRGTRVILEFECDDAYAAEILRDDLADRARQGKVTIRFNIKSVNKEST